MTFFSLSSYVSSLCSPGLPSRVFITYDQIEVGQMHHSEAKFHTAVFFSRRNIWLCGSAPLGDSVAVGVAGCLACFAAVELYSELLLA